MIERVLVWCMNFLLILLLVVFFGDLLGKGGLGVLVFLPFFGVFQPLLTFANRKKLPDLPLRLRRMTRVYWVASLVSVLSIFIYYLNVSFKDNNMMDVVLLAGYPLLIATFQQTNLTLQAMYD